MTRAPRLLATAVLASMLMPAGAFANDPDELMPCKILVVKAAPAAGGSGLTRFVCKPPSGASFALPSAGAAPTAPGSLTLSVATVPPGNSAEMTHTCTGLGATPGANGYKCTTGASVVVVKSTVVKGVVKGDLPTGSHGVPHPYVDDVAIQLGSNGPSGSKQYCARFPIATAVRNDTAEFKATNAPAPSACSPAPGPCCGPERITLQSASGTLRVGLLSPFPTPAGITVTLDSASNSGSPGECRHAVVVPPGGFVAPHIDFPALNYCLMLTPLGCESGTGLGGGSLWDGNGASGVALANVAKVADTSDGVCGPIGTGCNTMAGGAGADSLGDVDQTMSAASGGGVRSAIDIPVRMLFWTDGGCAPAFDPGCCASATYGDDTQANGEFLVDQFDSILTVTTNVASGAFVDKNGDGCKRAGPGFGNPAPDGPVSLTGTPATGPCCTVGQSTTLVSVGMGFPAGGDAIFSDAGYKLTLPTTVSSCGAPGANTCTVTTNACLK